MTKSKNLLRSIICVGVALGMSACIARGPDNYRQVTRTLVDTNKSDIQSCFGGASGKVVVDFTVEKKTGAIANAVIDSDKSSASPEIGACVLAKIDGLTIDRPDMRDGAAHFTWQVSN